MIIRSLLLTAASCAFAGSAMALDYPKYDGVYVRLSDDSFVEMHSENGLFRPQIYTESGPAGLVIMHAAADSASMSVVDPSKIISFIVKGSSASQPAEGKIYLDRMVVMAEHFKVLGPDAFFWGGDIGLNTSAKVHMWEMPALLADSNCAWGTKNFRVAHIDNYTTEYEMTWTLPSRAQAPAAGPCAGPDVDSVFGYSFQFQTAAGRSLVVYSIGTPDLVPLIGSLGTGTSGD